MSNSSKTVSHTLLCYTVPMRLSKCLITFLDQPIRYVLEHDYTSYNNKNLYRLLNLGVVSSSLSIN